MAVIGWASVVLATSLVPVTPDLEVDHLDKVVHACEYLLLAWLLVQAIRLDGLRSRDYLWLAWMFAAGYGLLIETLQALVPWRSADPLDALMNALGAAAGVWLGRHVPRNTDASR